jgi:hypothetical protein
MKVLVPSIVVITITFFGMGSSLTGQSESLSIKDRMNAYPSIAANGPIVAIAWGAATKDGASDVYVASSDDGGRTFHSPSRVNDAATQGNLSSEQPPRITLVPRRQGAPSIVVTWTSKASHGTRLLVARSDDRGKSFSQPIALPGTDATGNRGWEATATDRNGDVVAVWLDHRELAQDGSSTGHSGHQHGGTAAQKRDGVARALLSKLFFARIDSADSVHAVTGGVCYCCKTAIATAKNGAIYAAWRHVYPGNVRDIAFTMSTDGGRTFAVPARVSDDRWVLDGCPENGPAIGVDHANRVHVVWPTLLPAATKDSEPTLALFYASSADGRTFTPRQQLPAEGFAGHPQLAISAAGRLVVVWDELAAGRRRIAMARGTVTRDGHVRFIRHPFDGERTGSYPVVATSNNDIVVAWTDSSASQSVLRVETFR